MAKKRKAKSKARARSHDRHSGSRRKKRELPRGPLPNTRRARAGLPYKKFRIKTKGGYKYGYVSKLTGKRISKDRISKDPKIQGFREAFPDKEERTLRKIKRTLKEYRAVGFNPLEASPSLGRYFAWLRKNEPRRYKLALRAAEIDGTVEDLTPQDIHQLDLPMGRRKARKRRRR